MTPPGPYGPLILGSGGQIGRAFRALVRGGLWPGPAPLWHMRSGGDYPWDMLARAAPADDRLAQTCGIIMLAGGLGSAAGAQDSAALALAASGLARRERLPLLLCSSQAVYGRATGPQAETAVATPASDYGHAKLAMERAVAGQPGTACLRIGNVAGCDMALTNAARGPVALDQFPNGRAPRRCYIGPVSLAATMLALLARPALPAVINVAAPGTLGMDALLTAAGARWHWRPAPATALPSLELDLALMTTLAPLPADAGSAETLVAEARAAGWRPAP